MRTVSAIETNYMGILFRSRTEARWAVFFHISKLAYEYEKERIQLSNGESYLPDFYLPELNAYFEVKPSSESVVTDECMKARTLAIDRPKQRVWLAMGPPNIEEGNILPLDQWPIDTSIENILTANENRYRIMEDRRDEYVYWLHSEYVRNAFAHSYLAGGPGTITDHDRYPLIKGIVLKAYNESMTAFKEK